MNRIADAGFLAIVDRTGKPREAVGYSNSGGFQVSWTDPSLGCRGMACAEGLAYRHASARRH